WTYDTGSPIKSSPAIAHVAGVITNTVLIGSNTNRLYAISEDPALLRITKKANKEQVSVGDIITYQITVANNGTDPSNQTLINDIIPNGFKYVSGSTRLSIQSAAVAIQANPTGDSTLTFNIGTLAVGQTKILSYQLVVGSGVTFGSYENRAVCRYFDVQWKTSNTTRETVEVIPDPLFDLGTIIGKVFEDKNQNGRQDRGEKGVADAKIIMENGTMVKTDNQGRYHIPGVTPGTHLLKLQATTKNSKIVRITEGLLAKVNFGVSKTHDAKPKTQDAQLTLVALGDGELGHSRVSEDRVGSLDQMADNDKRFEDGWYHKGRAAYYLKARMPTTSGSKYIVTSSFDTDRGRHNTSGQSLFRYIDPDKYYLTYGDQSKINYKATDTQGLLYLLAEYKPEEFGQPEASFLWGNYHTSLNKLDLANYQRTLYGAQLRYQAVPVAGHRSSMVGRQPEVTLFTAQAKQRAAHNEFRGTGGSFYYLKHKDVIDGSEKIKFEVRDKITNRPLKTIAQSRGRDYEIDYSNGRIIFKRPVSSVDVFLKAPGEKIVQQLLTSTDILDGHQVYVVVDYEYEPDRRHLNQGNWGGHASQDFGRLLNISPVRVGVTYVTEEDADKDYELKGIDSTVQIVKGTQLYFEYAESTSTGVPQYLSHDGGLNFNNITSGLNPAGSAWSVKTDSQLTPKIKIGSYYKKLDPEFISANTVTEQGTEKYGGDVSYQVSEKITAFASQDIQELDPAANLASRHYLGGHRTRTSIMQGRYLEDRWSLTTEYRYQQVRERLAGVNSATNFNTNVAAARFDYKLAGSVRTFLQQQATLTGETNHQTTTGLSIGLLDIGAAWFQSTFGTKGNSGLVGVESNFGRSIFNIFSNYQVDNRRVGGRSSVFTVGSAVKPDPSLRLYSQQEFRTTPTDNSEGTVLGLDKKILERWQVGTSFEKGRVYNFNNNKTNRYVGSGYVTYHNKNKLRVSSKLEVRFDEGKPADKDQYLIYNSAKYYLNQDITLMGRVNWGRSTNEALEKTEGMFGEYGLSVGYRPVDFDRLNLLAKYTYLADINPVGQGSDSLADHTFISKQRFKIYALEAAYDLTDHFQLVEKYAFKNGQEKVGDRDYTDSDTDLWINRVNYHLSGTKELLKKVAWWQRIDLGVEYRILKQKVADDQKEGWLAETLYKLNQYMRIGVGYNFTDFTDDLRNNNDYSARGPFIRLVATVVY
ncbi:MAG: DUF11 domain-containing protein, partial [Planctomycetes bacterium]|nr:DUF11 domain-containing protein [Planctomycetota bacterium]